MRETIPHYYIDSEDIWRSYSETLDFLTTVNTLSKGKIPCKPVIKVIEDELVVGIITEQTSFYN